MIPFAGNPKPGLSDILGAKTRVPPRDSPENKRHALAAAARAMDTAPMREFDLLRHIFRSNASLPPSVTIPPGDDMGAVSIDGAEVLVTVDQIADGLHFELGRTPIEKIARKAITRNLSDVAAMAARPSAAVVAACLPRSLSDADAVRLADEMRRVAASYECPIIGGDLSLWDHPMILSVTILAQAWPGITPVRRGGARPGDVVLVTGELGGSIETVDGRTHHTDFEPRVALARRIVELATQLGGPPAAMIDLSDGLASDLRHLLPTGLCAKIVRDKIPVSRAAGVSAARDGRPGWVHAIADGEDYELCLTLPPEVAAKMPAAVDGVRLSPIGEILAAATPGDPQITLDEGAGRTRALDLKGWEHHS